MTRRTLALALSALLLAQLAWGALYIYRTSFPYAGTRVFTLWDDGMISMTYARNLARGHGLVWNPGEEPVQGYTNLGVTLLMAALHGLPLSAAHVSLAVQLLGLALLAGLVLLGWDLGRHHLATDADAGLATALAIAACAPLAVWTLQGSDAGFVALWVSLSIHALARRGETAQRFWAIAPGIALRSDAGVFYLALWGASLLSPGDVRRRLLHGGAAFALVWGGTLLFSWLYYGDPLPNTYYLKTTGMPRLLMLERGLSQLGYWVGGLGALALAGYAALRLRGDRAALLCAAVVLAAVAYHLAVGGDWVRRSGGRHLVPVLPPLLALAAAGARLALAHLPALAPRARRALALGLTAVAAVALNPRTLLREWFDPAQATLFRHYNAQNHRFARYLESFTYPDTSVAVHWGGIIPYFSNRPAIDVLGKSDRHIARLEVDEFRPGHSKVDWDYVLRRRRPDILDAASRGLENRADLLAAYYRVTTRQHGFSGVHFYLRRESTGKLTDAEAVLGEPRVAGPSASDAPGP